ncbi:MAG: M3 family metallopeptidase [Bdellovibrionota bacterium]
MDLPKFDLIRTEHVEPAVKQMLKDVEERFDKLENNYRPTWDGLVDPLAEISLLIHHVWSPVSHLNAVCNSSELRAVYERVQGDVVSVSLKIQQSKPIYQGLKEIKDSKEWDKLDDAQRRIIEDKILGAELNGIALADKERDRFNEISRRLSELQTIFQNNVLDATKNYSKIVNDKKDIEGMPKSFLNLASQAYNNSNKDLEKKATPEEGPWLVTLDAPCFVPLLEHCRNRDIREEVYRAYVTRASEGEIDNTGNILEILKLRQEEANLLGYENYADLSLSRKMADSVNDVYKLENELRVTAWEHAKGELEDLKEIARNNGKNDEITVWDLSFWSKRLQEKRFQFTDEELRPYFSFPNVLEGLFQLVKRIFDIEIKSADGETSVWHKDVKFFKVFDNQNSHIASFYLDPYSRPENKRGGAWMNDCIVRHRTKDGIVLPVAYLVCNCTPPLDGKPSLMTFREVETLFHEFGHGLQHMLTKVEYVDASGINGVEWDAVELPSQFMENWCYHRGTLMAMARHIDTGKSLPEELYQKLCAAKNFNAAQAMLRQIYFGLIDMDLHSKFDPWGTKTVFELQQEVAKITAVVKQLPEDRFLCAFSHIFAGGYAAGYYSYKWAEVLSADAFSAFEEVGLDNEKAIAEVGMRFKNTILALGGGKHPSKVFEEFRGREPRTDALLRHNGLQG